MKSIRIGSGAGYAGDRIEPAIELIEKGNLDYIIFECLAERTIAIGQQDKAKDSKLGYNQLLEYRMKKVLPLIKKHNVKVITNMGSANPKEAVNKCVEIAKELNLKGIKFACVTGDDILNKVKNYYNYEILENKNKLDSISENIISANAYTGIEGVLEALENNADVIITGRIADPSLTLAPIIHEFKYDQSNHEGIGQAILAGHLLECAGQVTGGYYADPGIRDVENLHLLGFPIVEFYQDSSFYITKVEGSGGVVNRETCSQQVLYEIHDPHNYITPDAIADFSNVTFKEVEKDKVLCQGATSKPRPQMLKVSVGYKDSFIGEGEISYGGHNSLKKAQLAFDIVKKRLDLIGCQYSEIKEEYIGYNSLYRDDISNHIVENFKPIEVRLRVSARTNDRFNATLVGNEVEALYTNGPAGGGGATKKVSEIIGICSIFVERDDIDINVNYMEV